MIKILDIIGFCHMYFVYVETKGNTLVVISANEGTST